MGGSVSPRVPRAAAVTALERSLLPLPQCTGRLRRRRRQQHHRPPRGLRRRLLRSRARGLLAAARGEPGSDGEAPAGRPSLSRPAPPRPARWCPTPRPRQPGRFLVGAGGGPGEVRPPHGRGASAPRARHGRVRALHKGRTPGGQWEGAAGPRRGLSGWGGGGGALGAGGTTPLPSVSKSPALPACRPQRCLPLLGGDDDEGGGGRPASGGSLALPGFSGSEQSVCLARGPMRIE